MKKCYFLLGLSLMCTQMLWGQWPASGGPETCGYGYTWLTSDDPNGPTYNWIDITANGTELRGVSDDNVLGPIQMGMQFQYYWTTRTQLWVGSNGYISFENGNIASNAQGFPNTPSSIAPNDVIAPFMCDLSANGPGNQGKVYYLSDPANQQFIVSYINMPFWTDANTAEFTGSNSFQVILNASDSTITFQYQKQQGSWDDAYDSAPSPMVVGIENVNAQCGLSITNTMKPTENTAVRFYPPASPGLDVADIAPISLQNPVNGGTFIPFSTNPAASTPLTAIIGNLGNVDVNTPTTISAQVRDTADQVFFQEQRQIAQMPVGSSEELSFNFEFTPPNPGPYIFEVSVSNSADINASNNIQTVELVAVDTSDATAVPISYASDNIFYLFNPSGTVASTLVVFDFDEANNGIGQLYEFYGYPIIIKELEFFVTSPSNVNPTDGFVAEIYQVDPTGASVPGQLLFRKDVPIDSITMGDWNSISVPISQGVIADNGFYIGYFSNDPDILLLGESAPPISGRSYEIIDGVWAQHRSNRFLDPWVRVTIDISNAFIPGAIQEPEALSSFEVFPNPTDGKVQMELEFNKVVPVSVKLFDMQGRKHMMDSFRNQQQFHKNYDLSHLPGGTYFLQVLTPDGQKTKKIILH